MIDVMGPKIIKINSIESSKGILSVVDKQNNLPFEIKRIFYVHSIPKNSKRGDHAHKKLKEFIWVINGEIEVITISKENSRAKFILSNPKEGLYIPEKIWSKQITITENSIYCVACSDYYDESDYIRDWEDFTKTTI